MRISSTKKQNSEINTHSHSTFSVTTLSDDDCFFGSCKWLAVFELLIPSFYYVRSTDGVWLECSIEKGSKHIILFRFPSVDFGAKLTVKIAFISW